MHGFGHTAGFGGSGLGDFGGRPEETVINNYYDSPGPGYEDRNADIQQYAHEGDSGLNTQQDLASNVNVDDAAVNFRRIPICRRSMTVGHMTMRRSMTEGRSMMVAHLTTVPSTIRRAALLWQDEVKQNALLQVAKEGILFQTSRLLTDRFP